MPIAEVVIHEAERLGMKQKEMGTILNRSKQGISAAVNGRRGLTREDMLTLAEASGSCRSYMEIAHDSANGIFASPYLDGENVELEFHAVLAKTIEETKEKLASMENLLPYVINRPDPNDELLVKRVRECLLQVIDSDVADDHFIAGTCERYAINVAGLFAEHERKLTMKGYLKRKTAFRKSGQ